MLAASEQGIVLLMDEALLPKGPLPDWDEVVRRHAEERVLSFPEPIDLKEVTLLSKGSLPDWDEAVRRHAEEWVLSFSEPIDLKEVSTEALLPKKLLPDWDEAVRRHAEEWVLSFSVPSYSQEVSMALARTVSPNTILEKIFDIQEVKTTHILKEKAEQFIEVWPLLGEVVGGRSLLRRKRG